MTIYKVRLNDAKLEFEVIVRDNETLAERLKAMYPNHDASEFHVIWRESIGATALSRIFG